MSGSELLSTEIGDPAVTGGDAVRDYPSRYNIKTLWLEI
jgi:hypothetical protein